MTKLPHFKTGMFNVILSQVAWGHMHLLSGFHGNRALWLHGDTV